MRIYFSGAKRSLKLAPSSHPVVWAMLVLILLVAFFLRTYRLDVYPRGPFGDEAAAAILAADVAAGRSLPILSRPIRGTKSCSTIYPRP